MKIFNVELSLNQDYINPERISAQILDVLSETFGEENIEGVIVHVGADTPKTYEDTVKEAYELIKRHELSINSIEDPPNDGTGKPNGGNPPIEPPTNPSDPDLPAGPQ